MSPIVSRSRIRSGSLNLRIVEVASPTGVNGWISKLTNRKCSIGSRVIESDKFTGGLRNRSDICSLVSIAVSTSKCQIAFDSSAMVLFGYDVIDLTSVERIRLADAAVLASTCSTFDHQTAKIRRNVRRHSETSFRALAFANLIMCSICK